MALKPCRECGKDVAVGAKSCPHCGVAKPAPDAAQTLGALGCVLTVFVTLPILLLFAFC